MCYFRPSKINLLQVRMALQTTVKISNVTNLSDARYCAGMGVDLLGFSMDSHSPDYIDPARFTEIRGWLVGVQIVGETSSTDPEQLKQLLADYQPDVLQVDEATLLPYLSTLGKPLILRVDLTGLSLEQLDAVAGMALPGIEYLLLDSRSDIYLDDELKLGLKQVANQHPVLLGIGFAADTIQPLLADLPVAGIALAGGNEERPGSRDFGALMDILEILEID